MWIMAPADSMEKWHRTNDDPEENRMIAVLDIYNMISVISSDDFEVVFNDAFDHEAILIGWCYLPDFGDWT